MSKIIFVSHCVLNIASKVVMYDQESMDAEENLRQSFLTKAIKQNIQFIQLPCPEFKLYGSNRWGHVSDQFDNPFFRSHCRTMLEPFILELQEYLSNDRYQVLGIIGIDGSPSCGVDLTCRADWYGSFEGREALDDTLKDVHMVNESGVFIDVLKQLLSENDIDIPVIGLNAEAPEKIEALLEL